MADKQKALIVILGILILLETLLLLHLGLPADQTQQQSLMMGVIALIVAKMAAILWIRF